jgi:hypothetical protein
MARKRPCRVCRRWFWPHPRAGDRQRTCSQSDCQRERHRRACAAWRRRHPDYDREDRLRRRLLVSARPAAPDPMRRVDWLAARDAVGLEVAVVIEEAGQVLHRWARDAVGAQAPILQSIRPEVPP